MFARLPNRAELLIGQEAFALAPRIECRLDPGGGVDIDDPLAVCPAEQGFEMAQDGIRLRPRGAVAFAPPGPQTRLGKAITQFPYIAVPDRAGRLIADIGERTGEQSACLTDRLRAAVMLLLMVGSAR